MTEPARKRVPFALLLFLLGFALYARTATFPFVEYDDPSYVRDNPHLARGLDAASLRWAWTSAGYAYNWHPLTWMSHALDVSLFGLDAGKHHGVNALLHGLNAALLFAALRALSGRRLPSALTAALFAVHPLRVESVAWISERKDLLAGAFFALSLWAYARHARAPSARTLLCVALAMAGGLLAKPTLVSLPFLLLLLDYWPLGRWGGGAHPVPALPGASAGLPSQAPTRPGETRRTRFGHGIWLEKLPLLALSAGSIVLTLRSQGAGGALNSTLDPLERLTQVPIAYAEYLAAFFWPHDLAVFYPHPAVIGGAARLLPALACSALLAFLMLGAWRQRTRRPWLGVGLLWFLGLLVPMIGLVQVGDQARADRYAYLSCIGLELALSWSLVELARTRPAWSRPLGAVALTAVLALALCSWRQTSFWRSSTALFSHALAVTQDNYVAHTNLGLALAAEDRSPEARDRALEHFEAARAIRPGFFQAELNAGLARYQRNELPEAIEAARRALAGQPDNAQAHYLLAASLAASGELEAADLELRRAAQLDAELAASEGFRRFRATLDQRLGGG